MTIVSRYNCCYRDKIISINLKLAQKECNFSLDERTMVEQSAPDFARVYENVTAYDTMVTAILKGKLFIYRTCIALDLV